MNSRIRLSFALLALAPRPAPAQDSVSVDPTVSAVVTGGRWTSEGRSGYYRVIVRTGGSQAGTADLTVQWLTDPARDGVPAVIRSVAVAELSGIAGLDRPQIGKYVKGWRIWIQVSDRHAAPGKPSTRAIDVGGPGIAKVVPAP